LAKLVRIQDENVSLTRAVLPDDVPAARTAPLSAPLSGPGPEPGPARTRPSARHARAWEPPPGRRTPLSIRSAERRRWSDELTGPEVAGLVVHGVGGIGKSTLARQIAARLSHLAPDRAITAVCGEVSAASLAVDPADDRLVILDNFDDNLREEPNGWTVRDPALASLLAGWTGKLLITSRLPFTLPGAFPGHLAFRHLGPLTRSGAGELAMSLPALGQLTESERERAWRLTAGHPRTMEYLDAVLARGARFGDVASRVAAAIEARTGQARRPGSSELPEPTELSVPAAEMIAVAAGDELFGELFDRLSTGAKAVLVRASVFRTPVTADVLGGRPGYRAECETAGLLTAGPGRELFVHRWTASELHRRLGEAGLTEQLAAAHRQAAGYWRARAAASPDAQHAELEARYHRDQASDLSCDPAPPALPASATPEAEESSATQTEVPNVPGADRSAASRRRRLRQIGLTSAAAAIAVFLAVEVTDGPAASRPAPAFSSAARAENRPGPQGAVAQAAHVRAEAAAWIARQISADAILACDPAMCAALVQQGIPAANLLVLGPEAPDPLGSAVVVATAAVRSMFGSRLVTVYAPQTLASFGTGEDRIDVRAMAPDGAAAYRGALAADLSARRAAGAQLLANRRIIMPPAARMELANGEVDARLLITLAAMAVSWPVHVLAFGDLGPGASMGTPLRSAEIVATGASGQAMLAFARAQRQPYLPAQSGLSPGPGGQTVLTIVFTAPGPLGLLQPWS
jgi:hypothetical protein